MYRPTLMLTWLSSDVGGPSATLVQHSPDVGLMSLAYCATEWRANTCRSTAGQTHFNVGLAQLQPKHGIECLLFFGA